MNEGIDYSKAELSVQLAFPTFIVSSLFPTSERVKSRSDEQARIA